MMGCVFRLRRCRRGGLYFYLKTDSSDISVPPAFASSSVNRRLSSRYADWTLDACFRSRRYWLEPNICTVGAMVNPVAKPSRETFVKLSLRHLRSDTNVTSFCLTRFFCSSSGERPRVLLPWAPALICNCSQLLLLSRPPDALGLPSPRPSHLTFPAGLHTCS